LTHVSYMLMPNTCLYHLTTVMLSLIIFPLL